MDAQNLPSRNDLEMFRRQLSTAQEPEEPIKIAAAAASFEKLIEEAGYRDDKERIRPWRMLWLDARWKLGHFLRKMNPGPGRPKKMRQADVIFRKWLKDKGIDPTRARDAEHLGALPEDVKAQAYAAAAVEGELPTMSGMLVIAKPYWHQAKRKQTHERIRRGAIAKQEKGTLGPFPLIYADPPWVFETHTPHMTHRMPEDHYPTMTDEEICEFRVQGKAIKKILGRVDLRKCPKLGHFSESG
jgi:hypothetical protein